MKKRSPWLTLLAVGGSAVASYYLVQAYQKARAACPPFRKRTFASYRELLDAFAWAWRHPEALRSLRENADITPALARKMALAVAGANGNRYAGSTRMVSALGCGLGREEFESLLRGELAYATAGEAPSLIYARRYAERQGYPEADIEEQLIAQYGARTARDIVTCVRMISLASLLGNTLDAFMSRLLGQPAPTTSFAEELATLLVFGLGIAPLIPALVWRVAATRPLDATAMI